MSSSRRRPKRCVSRAEAMAEAQSVGFKRWRGAPCSALCVQRAHANNRSYIDQISFPAAVHCRRTTPGARATTRAQGLEEQENRHGNTRDTHTRTRSDHSNTHDTQVRTHSSHTHKAESSLPVGVSVAALVGAISPRSVWSVPAQQPRWTAGV